MVVQLITGNTNPENVTFLMPRVTVLPVRPRRWLPRDIDPLTLIDRDLAFICYRLNNTLRKVSGANLVAKTLFLIPSQKN